MRKNTWKRILSGALALFMMMALIVVPASAETVTYVMDVGEVEDIKTGSKADGDTLKVGTDGYFTIFLSAKTRLESNSKSFADGFEAAKRLNFGDKSGFGDTIVRAVQIKTSGPATVKVWWVSGGDGRQLAIYSETGEVLDKTAGESIKNEKYISELSVAAAGTYYVGNPDGNNNYYKLEVTEEASSSSAEPDRAAWSDVAAPVITEAVDGGEGEISVTVNAVVGFDGGDEVVVAMYDASGKEVAKRNSILEKEQHTIKFTPADSGTYTFRAVLNREGCEGKSAADTAKVDFVFPLGVPSLVSATSKGGGTVALVWTSVHEATGYEVFCDGASVGTVNGTEYTVKNLTVGKQYAFSVKAVRGSDRAESNSIKTTATAEERQTWGFTHYGPSTNADNNGYIGSVNEDGKVTVYSEGGKGKIVPASVDGLAFYYTAIPTTHNFTLRAKVTVDSWTYSNGQEGFGLMAADRLGVSGDSSNLWNNQYMALATKIEYLYDADHLKAYEINASGAVGTKYTMKLGLGIVAKTGVTPQNLARLEASDTKTITEEFSSRIITLETAAGEWEKEKGTYNIIGNYTDEVEGTIGNELRTEFILEIQKNNTGYFITYYDEAGNILSQQKFYGPDDLSKLDKDSVYVGFFAARNARATFSDVKLTTIKKELDAPAEEKPVTKIQPTAVISSPTVTTSLEYPLTIDTNVSGTVKILVAREVVVEADTVTGGVRYTKMINLKDYGENRIQVEFTPDPDQDLGPDTVLANTGKVSLSATVVCNKGFYHTKTLYVSPDGLPNGDGSREFPFDIYTAVNNATAGQTIILTEGHYKLRETVRIQRGMDGTAEAPIRLIADPEAASRPVLDFQNLCAGIVHGGNHWYFRGFDVTNSLDGQKGFQVSGDYNVLDQIHAYYNGNTGIQLSRYSGTDLFPDWPAYNLVLNCTSYGNADKGYEDADGFAAKLTVGEGNVFDGCVAYNNADDGWDLYAKVETGCIGTVTIRNCVAYSNGVLEDGTIGGNGNGFKLGGESLSGKHVLENSYAFWNRSKGIDSNSCPDVIVHNCVSYNNGSHNVAFYTNNAGSTDFAATGIISFKDDTNPYKDGMNSDSLKPKGTQDTSKYMGKTNYYWYGSASTNESGAAFTADMFASLEFKGVARNADGTIDMQGFLSLTSKAPANTGAVAGGTASEDVSTQPEEVEHNYSAEWYSEDDYRHWHECECGARGDMADHTFVWVVTKEATETATGSKHEECTVCGHKRAAITTYYEKPAEPSPEPSAEPSDEPTAPAEPSQTPPVPAEPKPGNGGNTGVIIAVVAVVVIVAAVVVIVLLKKKKAAK